MLFQNLISTGILTLCLPPGCYRSNFVGAGTRNSRGRQEQERTARLSGSSHYHGVGFWRGSAPRKHPCQPSVMFREQQQSFGRAGLSNHRGPQALGSGRWGGHHWLSASVIVGWELDSREIQRRTVGADRQTMPTRQGSFPGLNYQMHGNEHFGPGWVQWWK